MGKLWTFGDSFTEGAGLSRIYDRDFKWIRKYHKNHIWAEVLSTNLGLELENYGGSGASNMTILNTVITTLPSLGSQDVVIIGTTDPSRYLIHSNTKHIELSPVSVDNLHKELNCWPTPDLLYTKEEENTIRDYYLLTTRRSEVYREVYTGLFDSICRHLRGLGITCLLWDCGLWGDLENIQSWSNDEYPDGHWSPNGNIIFAEYLTYLIQSNTTSEIIYSSHLKQNYQQLLTISTKHQYINYKKPLL